MELMELPFPYQHLKSTRKQTRAPSTQTYEPSIDPVLHADDGTCQDSASRVSQGWFGELSRGQHPSYRILQMGRAISRVWTQVRRAIMIWLEIGYGSSWA